MTQTKCFKCGGYFPPSEILERMVPTKKGMTAMEFFKGMQENKLDQVGKSVGYICKSCSAKDEFEEDEE